MTIIPVSNNLLTMKAHKPPSRLPADQRRASTVQAVLDLAAAGNPANITTVSIADRLHITQGALFRHFATKDAIWEAVMTWVAKHLLARVDDAAQGAQSSVEALEAVFMAHVDFAVRHEGVPRLVFGELQRPEDTPAKRVAQKLMSCYGKRLHVLIEEGKSQGDLACDVNTQVAVSLFIGAIQGLSMQSLLAGNIRHMRRDAPGVFAVYLRGIRRTP